MATVGGGCCEIFVTGLQTWCNTNTYSSDSARKSKQAGCCPQSFGERDDFATAEAQAEAELEKKKRAAEGLRREDPMVNPAGKIEITSTELPTVAPALAAAGSGAEPPVLETEAPAIAKA